MTFLQAGKRRITFALIGGFVLPCLAQAQDVQTFDTQPAGAQAQPTQIMDLSLMEALIVVEASELAGVFSYIPERSAPAAFADYVLHSRKALKRFLAKGQKDLKETGGVNVWDRLVYMTLSQINSSAMLPPGAERLSPKQEIVLSELILARPLSLQEITMARGARR